MVLGHAFARSMEAAVDQKGFQTCRGRKPPLVISLGVSITLRRASVQLSVLFRYVSLAGSCSLKMADRRGASLPAHPPNVEENLKFFACEIEVISGGHDTPVVTDI